MEQVSLALLLASATLDTRSCRSTVLFLQIGSKRSRTRWLWIIFWVHSLRTPRAEPYGALHRDRGAPGDLSRLARG